jgi:N,N'-diacetylbacillosaminyl-diphospho-undecaprenol alpha-1,3-N-acetylgalactosaminyltransferase
LKIALVLNDAFSMYHFRGGLIKILVDKGFEVYVIVPPGEFSEKLKALGARVIQVNMHRFISPSRDFLLIMVLYRIFKKHGFDLVHNMTIKPNIYGTISAKLAGIKKIVCLVSGIGFVFSDYSGIKSLLLRWPIYYLYRFAMHLSHKTWFQNPDDFEYFVQQKLITRNKGVVIRSGGISTKDYRPESVTKNEMDDLRQELKISSNTLCVLMVAARMIWSKGVREFVEAAKALHHEYPEWRFLLVCPKDPGSPDSVPESFISSNKNGKLIIIDDFRYDIKVFESISEIMVLPSYYREGVPRTLLEGLSMGMPIITTDHPGCRETVGDGKNGFLIPIKNSEKLIEKLKILMADESLRAKFGRFSRAKAETEFNESLVVSRVVSEVYGLNV